MKDWAASEPEAALNWYREKRASGELDPGLNDELHRQVISNLVCGMATTSPEMALDYYREMPREEMRSSIVKQLARALTENLVKTGDETWLSKMLEYHGQEDRRKALEGTFWKFASEGNYDAGLALVDKCNPDPEERLHYLGGMFQEVIVYQAKDILDWLGTTVTETGGPEIVGRVIAGSEGRRLETNEWLARQSPGAMRDHGYAGLAESCLQFRDFEEALGHAEQIDDAALCDSSQQMIAQRWLEHNREGAEKALPADLRDLGYAGLVESRLDVLQFREALEGLASEHRPPRLLDEWARRDFGAAWAWSYANIQSPSQLQGMAEAWSEEVGNDEVAEFAARLMGESNWDPEVAKRRNWGREQWRNEHMLIVCEMLMSRPSPDRFQSLLERVSDRQESLGRLVRYGTYIGSRFREEVLNQMTADERMTAFESIDPDFRSVYMRKHFEEALTLLGHSREEIDWMLPAGTSPENANSSTQEQ